MKRLTLADIFVIAAALHRRSFATADLFQESLYFQAFQRDSCDDHAERGTKEKDYDDIHD
jgi:hypothetical protein